MVKPDAAVLYGEMQTITGIEGVGAAIRNPAIVVEVLSKDSENYDKTEKADLYRSLPSLLHCILISQAKVEVQPPWGRDVAFSKADWFRRTYSG